MVIFFGGVGCCSCCTSKDFNMVVPYLEYMVKAGFESLDELGS